MQLEWKDYFDNRVYTIHEDGFYIIIPKEKESTTPLWCPLCLFTMKTADDTIYYKKYECCYQCGMKFADSRQEEWNKGWRPSKDEVEELIKFRKSMPLNINYNIFAT